MIDISAIAEAGHLSAILGQCRKYENETLAKI